MAASMAADSQCVLPFPDFKYCKIEALPCQTCLWIPVPTNKDRRHGCDTRFWKATYIWGIISWQARRLLPAGVRWLTGNRMNVTLYLIQTLTSVIVMDIKLRSNFEICTGRFSFPTQQRMRGNTFLCRWWRWLEEKTLAGRGSTWTTGIPVCRSVSAPRLLGGTGRPSVGC